VKEKDLYIDFKPQQQVYYVEKEDQSYGPIISGSYTTKNFLDDYWYKKNNLEQSLRRQLQDEEISPVYYYMLLQEIGPGDLAKRVGISIRKLKKHCKPQYFKKVRLNQLLKYAEVFNIPFVNLFQTFLVKQDKKEQNKVEQIQTKNPYYSITKIVAE